MNFKNILAICGIGFIIYATLIFKQDTEPDSIPPPPAPPPPRIVVTPTIKTPIPSFLKYDGIVKQLREWNGEAVTLTSIGIYGHSKEDNELRYIRVGTEGQPKVLITACIHGNEPHATASVMAYIGTMLSTYGKDELVTRLIDTRNVYFIPVVSPDSYPDSREVDGVDPNRDYINLRSPTIKAIQEFVKTEGFKAVWSGHTYGRVFLIPFGDTMERSPDDSSYHEVMDEVSQLSNYKLIRACEMYSFFAKDKPLVRFGHSEWRSGPNRGSPIYGSELDWYYRHGAFAVVCEYGTHQNYPSDRDIKEEFDRTYKGFLAFVDKAPLVQLKLPPGSRPVHGENNPDINE